MKGLIVSAIAMNIMLPISFLALGAAQRSGGDEGIWVVTLFYPLVIGAPLVSILTIALQMRRSGARI
jgi:hypothetical protein